MHWRPMEQLAMLPTSDIISPGPWRTGMQRAGLESAQSGTEGPRLHGGGHVAIPTFHGNVERPARLLLRLRSVRMPRLRRLFIFCASGTVSQFLKFVEQ